MIAIKIEETKGTDCRSYGILFRRNMYTNKIRLLDLDSTICNRTNYNKLNSKEGQLSQYDQTN